MAPATRVQQRGLRHVRALVLCLGALVIMLAPLVAAHHRAAERHAICEHGAEVHVLAEAATATAPASERDLVGPGPFGVTDQDGHHHCTEFSVSHFATATRTLYAVTAALGEGPSASSSTDAPPQLAALTNAPKTSPPA